MIVGPQIMVKQKVLLFTLVLMGINFCSTDALDPTTADYTTAATITTDYTTAATTAEYTTTTAPTTTPEYTTAKTVTTTMDYPTVTTTDSFTTATTIDTTSIPATENITVTGEKGGNGSTTTTTATTTDHTTATTTTDHTTTTNPFTTNSSIDVNTATSGTTMTTTTTTPFTTANTTAYCKDSDQCHNNGTCVGRSEEPGLYCNCSHGYSGNYCQYDACYMQPCGENAGHCEVTREYPFHTCPCYFPQLGPYFCVKERLFMFAIPLGGVLFLVVMVIVIACIVRRRHPSKSSRKTDAEAAEISLSSMEQTHPRISICETSATHERTEGPEVGIEDVEVNPVILHVEEEIKSGHEEVRKQSISSNKNEPTATTSSMESQPTNVTTSTATPEPDFDKDDEKENLPKQHQNSVESASTTVSIESECPKETPSTAGTSGSVVEDVVEEENKNLQANPATSNVEGDVTIPYEFVQTKATISEVSPGKELTEDGTEHMEADAVILKADRKIVVTDVEVTQTSTEVPKIDVEERGDLKANKSDINEDDKNPCDVVNNTTPSDQKISTPLTIDFILRQEEEEEEEEEEEDEEEEEEEEEENVEANAVTFKEDEKIDDISQINSANETTIGQTISSLQSESPKITAPTDATHGKVPKLDEEENNGDLKSNKSQGKEHDNIPNDVVKNATTTITKSNHTPTSTIEENVEANSAVLEADGKIAVEHVRRQSNPVKLTDIEPTPITTASEVQRPEIAGPIDTTATYDEEPRHMQQDAEGNGHYETVRNFWEATTSESLGINIPTKTSGYQAIKDSQAAEEGDKEANEVSQGPEESGKDEEHLE